MEYEICDASNRDHQPDEPLDNRKPHEPIRSNVDPRGYAEEHDRAEHIPEQED